MLDIENYRNQLTTVFQDYGKYEFTVSENIALNTYDDEFSVSQWHRLAIPRALYRKANLFIFDAFSSSLDPETEHWLFNDILALNTIVLAVTHRPSNIRDVRQDYHDVFR